MERMKWWLVVVVVMLGGLDGWATDITSADVLRSTLGNATISGNVVTLTDIVNISSPLKIKEGTMILDLNGKEIIYDRSGIKAAAGNDIAIEVNGATANVIVKNGTITVKAANGTNGIGAGSGSNASAIVFNDGRMSVFGLKLNAYPGSKGSGFGGSNGSAWVIDANGPKGNEYTLGDLVPNGVWIEGYPDETTYSKKGEGINKESITISFIKYNATYNTNELTPKPSSDTYTLETKDFKLPSVSKEGYEFKGWTYNGVDVDEKNLPTTTERNGTVNLTFNVKLPLINYPINYNLNGGNNPAETISSYTYESNITLPTPTRSNYRFMGWYLHSDFTGERQLTIPKNSLGEKTYYAKWYREYSISYTVNDGQMPADYPKTYISEESLELPVPTKANNGFVAWYENNNYTGKAYHAIDNGTTGDKIFFAKWLPSLLITYNLNEGENPQDAPKTFTEESPVITLPVPSRKGYDFSGWYLDGTFSGAKQTNIPTGTNSNQTYYAKWTPTNYKIIYNLNEGVNPEGAKSSYTIENEIPLLPPTRVGATFAGWFSDASFTQSITKIAKGSTGDKTLYAKWDLTPYTITFDTKGGSSQSPMPYTVDTDNTALPVKSRLEGYTLVGWYKDAACTQAFGTSIMKGTNGNFTLYAKWTPTPYSITYNTYTPDVTVPKATYTIEQDFLLPVPQRPAYSFAGWYESDRLTGEAVSAIQKGSTGNKTFYAKWSAGSVFTLLQVSNGKLTVKNGETELKSGDYVGSGTELTLTATPTVPYSLTKWVVNGKEVTGNPAKTTMPASGGLTISAVFADNRVAASAPQITTTPANTDKVPKGEPVKVTLQKTDAATTLYYSVDGAPDKAYTGEFQVSSPKDTLILKAIARKEGFKDGITTRQIIFDNGKITLSFDLPDGVKATNPTGGEVVSATTTGGSFEFKLAVDPTYYDGLDSMVVSANDSIIRPGSAGLYTLVNCASDITVTVSGLKPRTCMVTLQQTENGKIRFTDGDEETTQRVDYGASVSITAEADEDFKFLQWNTGKQTNPLKLTVTKDTTVSARFISDYKAYAITLPQMEGVTVKPFTGYTTEVKKDGTFKFYLRIASGYKEENLVVRANGEVLTLNKGGYAIYKINQNISISVEGIVRETFTLKVPDQVKAMDVETMTDATQRGLYAENMVLLHADAPEGKVFSKWNDGKLDNPRMVPAIDAVQLIPFFVDKGNTTYAKVLLEQTAGAGMTAVNANADAVKQGDNMELKVTLLPAYSQSEIVLTANGKKLEPETSLRASSETRTYLYTLPGVKEEVKVNLSGLTLNTYQPSVNQTTGGTVSVTPAGRVKHGDIIQLKAQPEAGKLFVKWWDGNTLNPYPYKVTGDLEIKGYFIGSESTVHTDKIDELDRMKVTISGGLLKVDVSTDSIFYLFDSKGVLLQNRKLSVGSYSYPLPSGIYFVKFGEEITRKIVIQ